MKSTKTTSEEILALANSLRWEVGENVHDDLVEAIYQDAARISDKVVTKSGEKPRFDWDRALDNILTSRFTGLPVMLLLLTLVFWLTIAGANVPSGMIATLLIDMFHPVLKAFGASIGMPWWLSGYLFDGVYLAGAWVVSVMLPPMAIF